MQAKNEEAVTHLLNDVVEFARGRLPEPTFNDLMENVTGPARFCAGMLHNLCALMLGLGEDRAAIEQLLALVLDNIEAYNGG